jgi:hypothetical protein
LSCGENHLLKVCRYFFHPTLQLLQQKHMIKVEEDARASNRQKRVGGERLILSLQIKFTCAAAIAASSAFKTLSALGG